MLIPYYFVFIEVISLREYIQEVVIERIFLNKQLSDFEGESLRNTIRHD